MILEKHFIHEGTRRGAKFQWVATTGILTFTIRVEPMPLPCSSWCSSCSYVDN